MPGKQLAIVMGSDSDLPVVKSTIETAEALGLSCEVRVMSAHRTPDLVREFVRDAEKRGVKVFIAAAGGAAHLAGVIASLTVRPVIGIPVESGSLKGLDALLSTVQMPAGVPVAAVAVGSAGATNAAVLAAQIVALSDESVAKRLCDYKASLAERVKSTDEAVRKQFP